jgi:hypothetical protein
MTRRLLPLVWILPAALGVTACDWTVFDKLQRETPVRALARPDNMDSNTYPTFVLPVTQQPRGSAELLVTGTDNVALADFTFGAKGELGTQTVSNSRFLLNDAKIGPLAVAAYLPTADGIPRIVAVTEEGQQPISIALDSTQADFSVTALGAALAIEAGALAVGEARVPGEVDVVIASGTQLLVLPNALAELSQSCDLRSTVSALAVGDGWVAAGQPAGDGNAWLVAPAYDEGGDPCLAVTPITPPANATGFGTAIVVADTDGDDTRDLVISAPRQRTVYSYAVATLAITREYPVAGGSTACGSSIVVGQVEGRRTLVIGDPGDPGEVTAPGVVWLQDLETPGADPKRLDRPNDDVQRFGSQVGVVSFAGAGGPVDLVWVTAEAVTQGDPGVVYVYYWVRDPDSDPRAF